MIRFSDVYVTTLARGLCQPNEQFVSAGAGSRQSFWTFSIPWFRHAYLLIATNERLIVVDHRKGLIFDRMDKVESFRWTDIGAIKLGGFFSKKLVVKDTANRTVFEMKLPKFLTNPLPNNVSGLQTIQQTWEMRRQMGAPSSPFGQLPPQQTYPAQAYAQPPAPLYNNQQFPPS